MAVQDIRSDEIAQFVGSVANQGNGTALFTGVVDGADYELGVMFSIQVTSIDATAVVTLNIQASDYADFSQNVTTYTPADDEFIGSGIVDVTAVTAVPTATGDPDSTPDTRTRVENRMTTVGLIANPRYMRVQAVITGATGATTSLSCFAAQKAEVMPVAEPDEATGNNDLP